MSRITLLGIAIYLAVCVGIFLTPQAAMGTALILVTASLLASVIVVGRRRKSSKLFWAGLIGMAWFVLFLGSAWETNSNYQPPYSNEPPNLIDRAYRLFIGAAYLPIARTVPAQGSIFEFRTLLDGTFKNYGVRYIPNPASYARLFASLSAWLIAGCVAAFIGRRERDATARGKASPGPRTSA